MGRGRAKAKQTKVARRLKYQSPNTDLAALERELSSDSPTDHEYEDPYDEYAAPDRDGPETSEEEWLPRKR